MAHQDEFTGQGGSYVVDKHGKRKLVFRTATTGHGMDAEPAPEPTPAPAPDPES